jgi:hypothetical protein
MRIETAMKQKSIQGLAFSLVAAVSLPGPSVASTANEAPAFPASTFKVMTALFNGYGVPAFQADIEALRDGPQQQGQIPLYVSFGSDGCLASVRGEPELASLDFQCRTDPSIWSLTHVFAEIDAKPEDFGLEEGRPAVLVLVPSMLRASCSACTTALFRASDLAHGLAPNAKLIEVDLRY